MHGRPRLAGGSISTVPTVDWTWQVQQGVEFVAALELQLVCRCTLSTYRQETRVIIITTFMAV
jgi:hypothetical protein